MKQIKGICLSMLVVIIVFSTSYVTPAHAACPSHIWEIISSTPSLYYTDTKHQFGNMIKRKCTICEEIYTSFTGTSAPEDHLTYLYDSYHSSTHPLKHVNIWKCRVCPKKSQTEHFCPGISCN